MSHTSNHMSEGIVAIETCKWLYLHEIGEPADNELRLVVAEARSGELVNAAAATEEELPALREILANSRPIVHGPGCRVFEITWSSYIAYSVRNESFVSANSLEIRAGRLFVEYSVSKYLDFVEAATFARTDFPGPFKHWGINCLNHVIDIVSTEAPLIKFVTRF